MTNEEMIADAVSYLNPHVTENQHRLFGNVAATLVTEDGNIFHGVCIDTGSGTGFCAEAAAIGAMVTAKEYKIKQIVAVWKDDGGKDIYVLPPCGRCREFLRQIDETNLETSVILSPSKTAKLRDLLPYNEWPEPV
jgi:cytidine deaminase